METAMGALQYCWALVLQFGSGVWWLLAGSLLDFPRGLGWVFWPFWLVLFTQPKWIDEAWKHFTPWGERIGGWYNFPKTIPGLGEIVKILFGIPFVGWLFWGFWYLPFLPIHAAAWIISHGKLFRFALTLAAMNLMVSKRVADLVVGWMKIADPSETTQWLLKWGIAFSSIPLTAAWYFGRSEESRDHAHMVIQEQGWLKGVWTLLAEDFLPKSKTWKCKACGHRNPLADLTCDGCGALAPHAPWDCDCGKRGISAKKKRCTDCGELRFPPSTTATTRRPSTRTPSPGTRSRTTSATVSSTGTTATATPTVTCPHCGAKEPAGTVSCGSCGRDYEARGVLLDCEYTE